MQVTTYGETAKTGLLFSTSQILFILSCVLFVTDKIWIGSGFLGMAVISSIVKFGMVQQEKEFKRSREIEVTETLSKISNLQSFPGQKDPVH